MRVWVSASRSCTACAPPRSTTLRSSCSRPRATVRCRVCGSARRLRPRARAACASRRGPRILPAHARRSGQALTSSTCLRSTTSAARPWWRANVLPLQSKRAIRSRPSWRCQLLNTTRFRARARRPSISILGATSSQASLCSWRIWPASCAPPSWDARSK